MSGPTFSFRHRLGAMALQAAGMPMETAAHSMGLKPAELQITSGILSLESKAKRLLLHAKQRALFLREGISAEEDATLLAQARHDCL